MRSKLRMRTRTGSRPVRGDWRPRLWPLIGLAAATAVLMVALDGRSSHEEPMVSWFRLKSVVPGERVPAWLHAGFTYRGIPSTDGRVRLFAADATFTAVISAQLVDEVAAPL